jgi:acetyl esterase/lipase
LKCGVSFGVELSSSDLNRDCFTCFPCLHGLPPMFVCTGDRDILRPDSMALVDAAKRVGVSVTLVIGEGEV